MKSLYGTPPPKPLVFVGVFIAIGLVTTMFVRFPDRPLIFQLVISAFVFGVTTYNVWAAYQPPRQAN